MGLFGRKPVMVAPEAALAGRSASILVTNRHHVNGNVLKAPFPDGLATVQFGLGCFWGAERCFWQLPGVYSTAVGYSGGYTENPGYEEVCSGQTGHTEAVLVIYDPQVISFAALLQVFWQAHDPTQGLRQGNDVGSQYRSAIYVDDTAQLEQARKSLAAYQQALSASDYQAITTEVAAGKKFYYAEDYHQQYLAKNPGGYCGLAGTGVSCPD